MKPLFLIVVAISVVLSNALPENIEDVKELPQTFEPEVEAEESTTQVRQERCTTCSGSLKLNTKSPKEVLAAIQALPGAEVHSQQSFEGCTSDKGCAGIKVKDGKVVERFGNLDSFNAAAAQDSGSEFSYHAAGTFDNSIFEGGLPFWWMNQNSPFKNAAAGGGGSFEKFSKSSSSSFSTSGNGGGFGGAVDLGANPFLNGDFSKLAGGFGGSGSGSSSNAFSSSGATASGQETRPSTYQSSSSFESSSFKEVDIGKNPFLNGGAKFGASGFGNQFNSNSNSNKFGATGAGFSGSTPGPFTASTAGSNVNLIQNTQKQSEFDYEQQSQQNIDEAFQNTGNVLAPEHNGGDLQQTCAGQGYICVHKAQCNNGVVNTNGGNLLQARTQKQYCNTRTEICCRIEVSGAGSQGSLGAGSAFATQGQGNLFQSGSSSFGTGQGSSTFNSASEASNFNANRQNSGFANSFGTTGSASRGSGFGSTVAPTTNRFNGFNNEVFKSTSQSNFVETDTFSAGSENAGVYRPGASGSGLKPGIPYLPPIDNTNSGSNVVPSTAFPSTFPTTQRPFNNPRPFTTPKPTYLPPVPSTSAPGYLPPVGESTNNRETRLPPNPTYPDGSLILDETRQPTFRPRVPTPGPSPNDIPAGCAAALKCTPIEFCTAEGVISNTSVILTREQDAYRVPLTDCKDLGTGLIGKCCRDPLYTDPWPSTQLGKWVPGVFGGNDGKYVPDSKSSPTNNVNRPQVTVRPPVTGSVLLNNFRTEKPTVPTFGANQITPGYPSSTVSPNYIQKNQGQGQYGQGQVTTVGQGQAGFGSQGQLGVIGIGQGSKGSQGQFAQGSQFSTSTSSFGQSASRGQGQVVTQGQGVGVTQGSGLGVSQGAGFGVNQGAGFGVSQGAGFGVSQGAGFGVSQGAGFGVTQSQGQSVTQGQGQITSQGQGFGVSQGAGQSVSQGVGQSVSQSQGFGVSQGAGQVVTQGQGFGVSQGQGQGVIQGQGSYAQGGRGQFGVGQVGFSQQGQSVSQGQGASVSRGQGQGQAFGQGLGVITGQGSVTTQGLGAIRGQGAQGQVGQGFGVTRGQGQAVSQGQGFGVSQGVGQVSQFAQGSQGQIGQGFGASRGQGQAVSQTAGQSVSQGFSQSVSQGGGQSVSQGVGQGVSQGQGFSVSRGQSQTVTQSGQGAVGGFGIRGSGSAVSQGNGFGISSGGQGVSQGFGQGIRQGAGQSVSQGFGQSTTQGFGQSTTQGFGQTGTQSSGQAVSQGFGQGVTQSSGQSVTQGFGQSTTQGFGQGVRQGSGQALSQGFGQGVSQGQGFGVSQGQGFGVSQGQGFGVSQGQGFGVSQGSGQISSQGGFGQGIRGGGGSLSFGVGQAITQGEGQAYSQGVVSGVRRGQGYTLAQGAGIGVENEYSESVQRVFLKQYKAGGQCGLLNPQKPYGNRNDLEVDFAEIPWQAMVLLQTNRSLLCGGVITRPDVVITSAACVDGLDAKNVLIKGGEWKLGIDDEPLPFQIVQVKTILRHPFYKRGSLKYDAAILVLAEDLRFAKNIYPICLPGATETLDAFYNGAGECIVTGWGKQVLQVHLQGSIMHSLNVSLINPGECEAKLSSDYPHLLEQYDQESCVCGQPTNPANNICKVDIGSALACTTGDGHYTLRGVYSWDSGCQVGNQLAAFYRFDLEWYEWAIGLIESVRFAQFSKGAKVTQNRYTSGQINSEIKSTYSGVKGGSQGVKTSANKFGFGEGQFSGQFNQFGKFEQSNGNLNFATDVNSPLTNTFSATYSEKKVYQSEPKIVTYTTKPEIVTFTTKPEYFTYTTKPKLVTYTTKPEIVTYTTKPKIVTYTTKPQIITYETSGSGTNPQYIAPSVTFNPSFSALVGKDHKHNSQCKCLEGKK